MGTAMAPDNLHDARWIGVEYDAPRLRLWVMGADGAMLHRQADGPADDTLAAMIAALPPALRRLPVIRSGWPDTPLTPAPAAPQIAGDSLPGMSQSAPAAIMRPQAGQIAGLLRAVPQFDGVVLAVGVNTAWAHVSAAEIVSFRSFLTPGLLAHLGGAPEQIGADFTDAVTQALSRPNALAADLASVAADCALRALPADAQAQRIAGLLIGAELAAAKPYWLGQDIVLIGDDLLTDAYDAALTAQGAGPRRADRQAVTLAALSAAWAEMQASAGSGTVN